MKGVLAVLTVLAVLFAATTVRGQSQHMLQKKASTQAVLDGLMRGDFNTIVVNAQWMRKQANLETYERDNWPGYLDQAKVFGTANDSLIQAAQQRNLDGAVTAYSTLINSCVQCHKIMRPSA